VGIVSFQPSALAIPIFTLNMVSVQISHMCWKRCSFGAWSNVQGYRNLKLFFNINCKTWTRTLNRTKMSEQASRVFAGAFKWKRCCSARAKQAENRRLSFKWPGWSCKVHHCGGHHYVNEVCQISQQSCFLCPFRQKTTLSKKSLCTTSWTRVKLHCTIAKKLEVMITIQMEVACCKVLLIIYNTNNIAFMHKAYFSLLERCSRRTSRMEFPTPLSLLQVLGV